MRPKPDPSERLRAAGPLEAFLRHPLLTLLPVALAIAGAVVLGVTREPEYTAKARVNVGTGDVPPFYLQQVTSGNAALATSYARAIATVPVLRRAARESGISAAAASDRLSATPIPSSTLIELEAQGPSSGAAVILANAGGQSLIAYINRVTRVSDAGQLLKQYRKAQAEVRRAEARVRALSGKRDLPNAQLAVDAANLKASDLANRYRDASTARANESQLTLIAPAAKATSDERKVLERILIIGLAAGIVLGLALALMRTNWQLLRSLRHQ